MKPAFSDDRDHLDSDEEPATDSLAAKVLGIPFGRVGGLFEHFFGFLMRQMRTGIEDRRIAKEFGATAPCPKCGRVNSIRTKICPQCETRLSDPV